jgi:enamine deaminase RidA (YjgF/YER057c/UK114 family)
LKFEIAATAAGTTGISPVGGVVARGAMVAVSGVAPDPVGDVQTQTRQVLERIDRLLEGAGTDKSKILTAHVRLSDMGHLQDHNLAWNEWVDCKRPPLRVCARAELLRPGTLLEVSVTAAR